MKVRHAYVDPLIVGDTVRERLVLAEIRRLGLTAHKLHAKGSAIRVSGPGVDITASSLGALGIADLLPADHAQVMRQHRALYG